MSWRPGLPPPDRPFRRAPPWLALAFLASAGCQGDSHAIVTLDDLIDEAARAYCAWQFRCCVFPEFSTASQPYATESDCVPHARLELSSSLSLDRVSIADGRAVFNRTAATDCVHGLEGRSCATPVAAGLGGPSPFGGAAQAACRHVLLGQVRLGAECRAENECAPGTRCLGVETAVRPADDLSSLFAGPTSILGTCAKYQRLGEVCNVNEDCDPGQGLYCRGTDGSCQPLGQEGDPCFDPPAQTPPSGGPGPSPGLQACDAGAGLFCDDGTETCRHLPGDGEPCLDRATLPPCDPDPALMLGCVGAGFHDLGVCKKPGQLGDECGGLDTRPCAPGLSCAIDQNGLGHCAPPPGLDESCDGSGRCAAPFVCDPELFRCAKPGASSAGAPCGSNTDCASLVCTAVSATQSKCGPPLVESMSSCAGPGGAGGTATGTGGAAGGAAGGSGGGGGTMVLPPDCTNDAGTTADTISDFEDGSATVLPSDGRRGEWFAFDDGTTGCQLSPDPTDRIVPTLIPGGRCKSTFALELAGSGCAGPGAGWGVDFAISDWSASGGGAGSAASGPTPYDASAFSGILFWARASDPGITVRVSFPDQATDATGNDFSVDLGITFDWVPVLVRWTDLQQQGTGPLEPAFDAAHVLGIRFGAPVGGGFDLWIDDVSFVR